MGYDPESPDVIGREPSAGGNPYTPGTLLWSHWEANNKPSSTTKTSTSTSTKKSTSSGSRSSGGSVSNVPSYLNPNSTSATSVFKGGDGRYYAYNEITGATTLISGIPGEQPTPYQPDIYTVNTGTSVVGIDRATGQKVWEQDYAPESPVGPQYEYGTDAQGRDYYFDPLNASGGYQFLNPAGGA